MEKQRNNDPFPGVFPPNASAPFFANSLFVLLPRRIQTRTVDQWTASVQQDLGFQAILLKF